ALSLRVAQDAMLAMSPADAAPLYAAHRDIKTVVDKQRGIHANGPRLELSRYGPSASLTARPHRRIQPKLRIVGSSNSLVCAADRVKRHHGTERFLCCNGHFVGDICQNRGINKAGAKIRTPPAAGDDACALMNRELDTAEHFVCVIGADQAAHVHIPRLGPAEFQRRCLFDKASREILIYGV